jgi:hypothetical protein
MVNVAKDLWKSKQSAMYDLNHAELIPDDQVAEAWDKSLRQFHDRIEKLDNSLQFFHQHENKSSPDSTPESKTSTPKEPKSKSKPVSKKSKEKKKTEKE